MDRVLVLTQLPIHELQLELLRVGFVCSCAFALIAAGQTPPF
ncbi:MAG: hypothetical protein P8J20_04630 [Novosphingobium sp.]|nr:hypothetical protein [Novosphingobium sp.]